MRLVDPPDRDEWIALAMIVGIFVGVFVLARVHRALGDEPPTQAACFLRHRRRRSSTRR